MKKSNIKPSENVYSGSTDSNGLWPIWCISPKYKYPVIGTCLSAEENKKIVKKAGFKVTNESLYDLHLIIMTHLDNENPVSRKVDNYLKNKYRAILRELNVRTVDEIKGLWRSEFENGVFDGLFFYIACNRSMPGDYTEEVFGAVHMMSHSFLERASRDKHKIRGLTCSLAVKDEEIAELKRRLRDLRKENLSLRETSEHSQKRLASMEKSYFLSTKTESYQPIIEDNRRLREEVVLLEKARNSMETKLNDIEHRNRELESLLAENSALNRHLKKDIEDLASHFSMLNECHQSEDEQGGKPLGLFSKRVLIVGGMTKIKHLYQHLVESSGGEFEYHDGYLKRGSKGLDRQVKHSDIIICPVNCNSHNACSKVKKLCQKHKKPLKILSNASISAITTALAQQKQRL